MLRKTFLVITILLFTLMSCVDIRDPQTLTLDLNKGIDTIEVNSSWTDAGAYASLEGKAYAVEVISNNVDTSKVGLYQVIYRATFADVEIIKTRYVDVIDETPPSMSLKPGIDTIKVNTPWIDAGVNVSDNSDSDVIITVEGQVLTSEIGEHQITYKAIDAYGNESSLVRYVHVYE
ncbi:DUF5011 domain-containing protein [Mycoplasmatota bacterium]|nr:DUF5011 domain-containing protein [Mycoplasmatota bacterium]